MSSPCPSPCLSACGKRPRTPQGDTQEALLSPFLDPESSRCHNTDDAKEPSAKVPRPSHDYTLSSMKRKACAVDVGVANGVDSDTTKPMAVELSDFTAPGGTERFRPRPEWFLPHKTFSRKDAPQSDTDVAIAAVARQIDMENNEEFVMQNIAPDNPLLFVAPDNGLLPDGAFQDYAAGVRDGQVDDNELDRSTLAAASQVALAANESCSNNATAATAATNDIDKDDTPALDDSSLKQTAVTETTTPPKPCFFGKDWDPALNLAIRENATEAALALLERGAPVDAENAKAVTPLILAAQKGNWVVARELLRRGANPALASTNGTTALLQAAHFGHAGILELLLQKGGPSLMELANYNHTTPLMRAAQEGHAAICRVLLQAGAQVNRRNRVQMTALMLASQRGHAVICELLIGKGAELDAMTGNQQSTSLLLACKRGNVKVVKVLVTAGCELWIRDSKGRTAREVARRRDYKELVDLLDSSVQIDLMQRKGRQQRNFEMIRLWDLLQEERATIEIEDGQMATVHQINSILENSYLPFHLTLNSTSALLRAMTLPRPLVELISQFLPLPHLWPKRMAMLTKRTMINPDAAVTSSLDLIDEILEEGGYLAACDAAQVTPPTHFESWKHWKAWGRQRGKVAPSSFEIQRARPNVTMSTVPPPKNPEAPTFIELRRQAGFLQVLANRSTSLARVLGAPPYNLPASLIQQLITSSDVASLTRRMGLGGVSYDPTVAMDLVMLISRLCAWYWREREQSNP